MALTLRSREGCAPNEKLTRALTRLVKTTGAAQRGRLEQDQSEFDVHHEKETWNRLKADKGKDLVLMFGEDDVRVFHRAKPTSLDDAEGADESARGLLAPVDLDQQFVEYMSRPKRAKPREKAPDRAGGAGGHEATNTEWATTGEPIPHKVWHSWIRGARASDANDHKDDHTKQVRRVRHHRKTCRFHPNSTSNEFNRLALQTTFPENALRASSARLAHAAGGSASGMSQPRDLEEYFAPPVLVPPRVVDTNLSFASTSFVSHSLLDATRLMETPSSPSGLGSGEGEDTNDGSTFLTEAQTIQARCKTPDLSRFELPPRPHSLPGDFADCDCTPRSSVYELSSAEEAEERARAARRKRGLPPLGSGKKAQKRKVTTMKIIPHLEDRHLTGLSDRADAKLTSWNRDFSLTKVRKRSQLNSILQEREEQRAFSCAERRHLDKLVTSAQQTGAEWRVSRQMRCTTPEHSSVWNTIYSAIGETEKRLAEFRELYVAFTLFCSRLGFPSTEEELVVLEKYRQRCMKQQNITAKYFQEEVLTCARDALLTTRQGVLVANHLRELIVPPMSTKEFFAMAFAQESMLSAPLHSELFILQKRLATAARTTPVNSPKRTMSRSLSQKRSASHAQIPPTTS